MKPALATWFEGMLELELLFNAVHLSFIFSSLESTLYILFGKTVVNYGKNGPFNWSELSRGAEVGDGPDDSEKSPSWQSV